jgi:outer membrane protein assembly factor BamB
MAVCKLRVTTSNRLIRAALCVALAGIFGPGQPGTPGSFWQCVIASDWPRWGGRADCNMVSDERGLPTDFVPGKKSPQGQGIDHSTTKNVLWTARLGTQTYGNVTVANGRVVIGTNDEDIDDERFQSTRGGVLKCFDQATGKLVWQLVMPRREKVHKNMLFDHLSLGVCSSPTIDGDRVYVVSSRGELLCLDLHGQANGNQGPFLDEAAYMVPRGKPPVKLASHDADIIWMYDLIAALPCCPQDASCSAVLIHGDYLYVGTSNGVDESHDRVPFPHAPSLVVFNKHTGRLVAADAEDIGTRLFHGQWSSPSMGIVNGKPLVLFGAGDGVCYAFQPLEKEADTVIPLKRVWSYDCNPPHYKFRDGKPINYRDGDRRRNKGNTNDGTYIGPSEIIGTPVFYRNRVYVAIGQDPAHGRGKGLLHCIDATKTGDITQSGRLWWYDALDRSISTVAIADGLLYIADIAGKIHCLDAETGRPYWVHETNAETWSSTLVADGKVYVGTKRNLVVLQAGKEKKVLAQINLGSPVYCTPVVADGVLYVASQRYLWAVKQMGETGGH